MDQDTWRSVPSDELVSIRWGDIFVVYHKPSGLTHVLNGAMFCLLDDILCVPRDSAGAIDGLSQLSEDGAVLPAREQILESLVRLEQLGLVRRE